MEESIPIDLLTSSLVWERVGEMEESIPLDSFPHHNTGKKKHLVRAHGLAEVRGKPHEHGLLGCGLGAGLWRRRR
jgi:hypothetical protein